MDSRKSKKRSRSRSLNVSPSKHAKKKKSHSRCSDPSSSPSPVRKRSSLAKYNADISECLQKEGKDKKKRRKRKVSTSSPSSSSSSSESSTSSSSSSSSDELSDSESEKRSHQRKKKKQRKGKKKLKKKSKKQKKKKSSKIKCPQPNAVKEESVPGPSVDLWQKPSLDDSGPILTDEQKTRIQAMKPMTKEEWDARQSVVRRVLDPETGRIRLIKGDGEVLEEIVSKERHKEINKHATQNDGFTFQMRSGMF
ncbi:ADP-ribosylation factor-like protein 6-interacting protein 4 [Bombina bombina]|uniref:ADP-ribosylation factor-like protein 6-interacting protein 4 n=1 Tax=Bombina bombina TaxID=8345 RepID=UPI00235A6966|nr:ADP-ribosylation factor-like protein 6-interacting protein 4 [Bombina bombina]XP_053557759.1 ADP-ribosylation factor-like protein 6-interacting protein 4 [Bombina bombina]